ncbi:hypothetical protein Tco_0738708 [Tanacetum coccineum]
MAEIGCNWARIGPSKSSQSLSNAHKWAAGLEYGRYGVSKVLDTAYRGFLGVGTTFDIFQIRCIVCQNRPFCIPCGRDKQTTLRSKDLLSLCSNFGVEVRIQLLVGVLIRKARSTIRTLQNSSRARIQITWDAEADPYSANNQVEMRQALTDRLRISDTELGLDIANTLRSLREIADKGDLSYYWASISSDGNFLRVVPSYTSIRDLLRRLCHRLIAGLIGLHVIARELPLIYMDELVWLSICDKFENTWVWVASVLERQHGAMAKAPEGAAVIRTMTQRMARLEEEVHRLKESLDEQHEVVDIIAIDFSRFTVWAARGISQLLNVTDATYTMYSETPRAISRA